MSHDTKRISRLTAIIIQLQTQRLSTAPRLANKFNVSVRTIYRDIRALEQAGIPIITEDGKGYTLMEHYRLPPVTFTEAEANALITAEQLILKNKDLSLVNAYSEAITKIKSILKPDIQDNANLLAKRVQIKQHKSSARTSSNLSILEFALTNFRLTTIIYTNEANKTTNRAIEPFAILGTQDNNWLLLAWCRRSDGFRFFRLDRIKNLDILSEKFEPHKLTLQEYFKQYY